MSHEVNELRRQLENHGWDMELIDAIEKQLWDARNLARNLFQMTTPEQWRATGGDDGQGHYEGDYRAAGVEAEIRSWGTPPRRGDG